MKFDESGKLFVYVKQGYNNVGVLCLKLVDPQSKNYVIGWSTIASEDEGKFNKKIGKKIAENRADKVIEAFNADEFYVQDRSTLFKMRRNYSVLMYRKIAQVAEYLKARGYEPTSKALAPSLYFEPLTVEELVKNYFDVAVTGPDGGSYRLLVVDALSPNNRFVFMEENKKRWLDLGTMEEVLLFFAIGK